MIITITLVILAIIALANVYFIIHSVKQESITDRIIIDNVTFTKVGSIQSNIRDIHNSAIKQVAVETGLSTTSVLDYLKGYTIHINNFEKWEYAGQVIAGLCFREMKLIYVGSDLLALAHEYRETIQPDFHVIKK